MSTLPCFPCPHSSACCTWGVSLTEGEAVAIRLRFGAAAIVWSEDEEGYRTATSEGRCVFLEGNRCRIHEDVEYPSLCAAFPRKHGAVWCLDDVESCPELQGRVRFLQWASEV